MSKDDGGPAFPLLRHEINPVPDDGKFHPTTYCTISSDGMTLRDYFAAKALEGFWACPTEEIPQGKSVEQAIDEMCGRFYQWADAMLKERAK